MKYFLHEPSLEKQVQNQPHFFLAAYLPAHFALLSVQIDLIARVQVPLNFLLKSTIVLIEQNFL